MQAARTIIRNAPDRASDAAYEARERERAQRLEQALAGAMPYECRSCRTIKTAAWVAWNSNRCAECDGLLVVMR